MQLINLKVAAPVELYAVRPLNLPRPLPRLPALPPRLLSAASPASPPSFCSCCTVRYPHRCLLLFHSRICDASERKEKSCLVQPLLQGAVAALTKGTAAT